MAQQINKLEYFLISKWKPDKQFDFLLIQKFKMMFEKLKVDLNQKGLRSQLNKANQLIILFDQINFSFFFYSSFPQTQLYHSFRKQDKPYCIHPVIQTYRYGKFFLTINMNIQKRFTHTTVKNDYTVLLEVRDTLKIRLEEKYSLAFWQAEFNLENIKEVTFKTGHELFFEQFVNVLIKALEQKDIACYIDILTSQDLENLKAKRNNQPTSKPAPSKSNKRYLILTYMTNDTKYHYPLSLPMREQENDIENLKQIYKELRVELESVRTAALNETQNKTQNSFSIEYEKKGKNKEVSKLKQVDQVKSQNQMLKAKLARLEEQAIKKKANIEIEAAIERTKQLKEKLETQNLELVDWKNRISDEEGKQIELKKTMEELHKKICRLLISEKQVSVRKKGEETEKELKMVKNAIKKNSSEQEKLKKELDDSKGRLKQLEQKAKKLTSEKNVIQRGQRRGPYSSAGSVRSFGSYNSSGSKRSTGSNNSLSSNKPRSNYSYNSNRFR